jgi:hypothetical protein
VPGTSQSTLGYNGSSTAVNPYVGPAYSGSVDPNLLSQLTSTYGEGAGDSLYNYMMSGAGYNPQVAQQLLATFQPEIAQGQANLASQFGAAGAGNGSSAALAQGAFQAQVVGQEDTILAQQYDQGEQNFQNILLGTSGVSSGTNVSTNTSNILGDIGSILGLTSAGAGAAQAAGVGAGGGTLDTIFSILSGL